MLKHEGYSSIRRGSLHVSVSESAGLPPLTYSTLDLQGFKLYFKLIWEPFESQFGSIEARFANHTIAVVRLANVDYQNRALEYQSLNLGYQNQLLEYNKRRGK